MVDYTEFGRNALVMKIENLIRYIPFVFAIPIVVLSVVNAMIIYQLFKINTHRRLSLGVSRAYVNSRITIMLVCIILMFLLSQVPLAILRILYEYDAQYRFNEFVFIFQLFVKLFGKFYSFCVFW